MSGLTRSAGTLVMILSTVAVAQSAQDHLQRARALAGKSQFAPALKLAEKAESEAGNDLETTLELLELTGVCNAGLKKAGPAKTAFQHLLSLAPAYKLTRKGPPAVVKAFNDAKASASPLSIVPAVPDMSTGRISEIAIEVKSDVHKLARVVVFNYRVAGAKWKSRAAPIAPGRVGGKVDAPDKVEWYATILGANDAEVMRIRSVDSPITHTYSAPSAAAASATPTAEAAAPARATDAPRRSEPSTSQTALTPRDQDPAIDVVESGRGRARWVAPTAVTLLVGGAAAAGVGTFFGAQAADARKQFSNAVAGNPQVVMITRQRAMELDRQAQGALIANTLWGVGGGLLLTGLAVALFGPDEAAP